MISAAEMAVVDANAEALGVPRKQLMESSGNAVARVVREAIVDGASADAPGETTVALVSGRGNNGGDAFVTARFLDEYDVSVHLLGRAESISTEIARENWDALVEGAYDAREVRDSTTLDLGEPDVVVDALLGTGVRGEPREREASAIEAINAAREAGEVGETGETGETGVAGATVVSVDVPSGVDADTGEAPGAAVDADHVVTFHDAKPGLDGLDCAVTVADIGIPAAAERFVERGDLLRLSRADRSHKGEHGEVLVVGGGPYTGAPALAAQAALRAGADLARVACPSHVEREIQGFSENLIVQSFDGDHLAPGHVDDLLAFAADQDVVVFGPGLGAADETLEAVRSFLADYDGVGVIDADALQVVPDVDTAATLVCTPHQGELRAMGGETSDDWRERCDLVESFASELGHVLLVKGAHDVVSNGDRTRVGRTGNPGMTVGGTGDVLAGATGALACTLDPFDAACVAAYANGRAGDLVVDGHGYGLTATDLLDELPTALWGERP